MAPDSMAGADAVEPRSTHTDDVGQATWVMEVRLPLEAAASVSLANVADGVVAPYMSRGPDEPAPILPTPVTRHSAAGWGRQVSPLSEDTDVRAGKESAVQARLEVASPVGAVPEITMGPLGLVPTTPVP
jgi:hypothetical protein